jgi:drug/metabolite transporter (DMT)-like permease
VSSLSPRARLIIAFAALYIVWGTTYLGIKAGLSAGLPPALFAGVRTIPAGLILLGIARLRGARLSVTRDDLTIVAIVGILLLIGGQYGTFLAEQTIPSGLAALIVAVLPLWVGVAESALPDMQRPGRAGWIGLVIGFSGLAVLLAPRLVGVSAQTALAVGIALQLLATWLWTGGSIYSKRHPVRLDPMVSTAYQMLIAGVLLVALGTVLGEWPRFELTAQGTVALLYLTLVGSCIGFSAFIYALGHAPASKVMTYAYVNPVIAVFVGWAAGRAGLVPPEPLTTSTLVAMVIIVVGVAIATAAPTLPARLPPATTTPPAPLSEEPLAEPLPSDA